MKKTKLLLALVLSAGAVLASCGDKPASETMTDEDIVKAVLNSSAVITDNKAAPIRDDSYGVVNKLEQKAASYLIAQTSYSYLSDSGNTYDVAIDWDYAQGTLEEETVSSNGSTHLELRPVWGDFGTTSTVKLTATATLNDASASLTYTLTIDNNKNLIAIEDIPNSGLVAVRGEVVGFIDGDDDQWYGILVQSGSHGFMVYNIKKNKVPSGLKVGDIVEVSGTSSPYNGTKQIKGSDAQITILSGEDASSVAPAEFTVLGHPGFISQATYGTMSRVEGAKVTSVELVDNHYNGQVTEGDYVVATLEYKGAEMFFYADRYNSNMEAKKAAYDLLKQALDSNGEKTVNITGMQAMNKEVVWDGDNNDMNTTDGAALMLVDSSLIEVVDEPYQEATSIDITYTGNLFVGSSLQLSASLEGETITWATSDPSVATVDENGLVTGVSEGTVTISASTESGAIGVVTLTASVRQGEPDYLHASVAEVLEAQDTKEQAYVVRGKIKGFGSKGDQTAIDQYGNVVLVDENDATKEIVVYGVSATYSALSYDEATGEYKFSNPKDSNTNVNTKDLKVGDTISMVAIRSDYKGTKQIVGVLAATNDTRIAPTKATLKEVVEGAPLSATSGTASGQYIYEVTATIKSWATNKPGATEYGDMVVTDESGLEVAVYGATAQDGKISYNYNGSGKYSIGNPKDWLTNEVTKDLKVGDKITFTCVRSDYNGNIQIVCDNVRLAE